MTIASAERSRSARQAQLPRAIASASDRRAGRRRSLRRRTAGLSAAGGSRECFADRVESLCVESGDRLGQERLGHGSEVVEADGALDGHPVGWSEFDFGVEAADGAGHERDDDVAQPRQRFVAREDNDGAAPFLLELEPGDLAAGYQGSSRIASRAFVSAQASSVARCPRTQPTFEQLSLPDESGERCFCLSVGELVDQEVKLLARGHQNEM